MSCASQGYALGIVFILLDGLVWVGASVITKHVYEGINFKSPLFLTALANSLMMLYLPLWYISSARHPSEPSVRSNKDPQATSLVSHHSSQHLLSPRNDRDVEGRHEALGPHTHSDVLRVAAILAPIYLFSNALYNYSIFMTSISSSTIISNLSGSFAFFFSWYLGMEGFSYGKLFGIAACFIGAVCVGMSDSGDHSSEAAGEENSIIGDVVALSVALLYGLYTVTLQYLVPDDNGIPMTLLLGYVGMINTLIAAPVVLIMHWSGMETLSNLTWGTVWFICLAGLCNNVLSDYLWARSVLLTSPTVATVGLSVAIPIAMFADYLFQGDAPTALSAGGACLVVSGFCLVSVSGELEANLLATCRGKEYQSIPDLPAV